MRFVTFVSEGTPRLGVLTADGVVDLNRGSGTSRRIWPAHSRRALT